MFVLLGANHTGLSNVTRGGASHITIETRRNFTALGTAVATGDIDGDGHNDLLLGCPQAMAGDGDQAVHTGSVFGFLASPTSMKGGATLRVDVAGDPALAVNGTAEFGFFGQSLAVVTAPAGARILLVGAPYQRTAANGTVGAVHGLALASSGPSVLATPSFVIAGTEPLGGLGHALAASTSSRAANGTVAVSCPGGGPGSRRRGTVYLYAASALSALRGNATVADVAYTARIHGDADYGRLGWSLALSETQLALGAPFVGSQAFPTPAKELGAAYWWRNGSFPSGDCVASQDAAWASQGTRLLARFGGSVCVGEGSLVIGSPRSAPAASGLEGVGVVDVFRA